MNKLILTILLFVSIKGNAAPLFGPSNYDECVLEKMKEQTDARMLYAARRACEHDFEVRLDTKLSSQFDWGKINVKWNFSNDAGLGFEITKNDTEYNITRVVAKFSTKTCEEKGEFEHELEINFVTRKKAWNFLASDEINKVTTLNPSELPSGWQEYKCVIKTAIYGKRKS